MAETPKKPSKKATTSESKTAQKATSTAAKTRKTTSAQKTAPARAATKPVPTQLSTMPDSEPEQLHKMVAEAAYHRAEKHGFQGDPLEHWLAAEAEIMKHIR